MVDQTSRVRTGTDEIAWMKWWDENGETDGIKFVAAENGRILKKNSPPPRLVHYELHME